jgi:hypothetical protein
MRGLMFRNAEHYFAKAIILAAEGLTVNKVIPGEVARVPQGCHPRDRV